ncbi:MAG TPA: lipocalin-like domain-containing protein [Gammaproteobacteria bacterium]|nr:lipocalin-like domain-containing protein [Gammaproteobacteria bacterium]
MLLTQDLVGEWTLQEFMIERSDGMKHPWRKNAKGLLIYLSNGRMSISINSDVDGNKSLLDNKYNSILFYTGTFEILHDNKVIHHVINASDPDRIGKEMVREVILDNEKLKLVGRGEFGIATLTWNRIVSTLKDNNLTSQDSFDMNQPKSKSRA